MPLFQKARKPEPEIDKPGYYKGKHYSAYVPEIISLKKTEGSKELEFLLLNLVEATEAQSKAESLGVAPFYYEELAILYRKQKLYSKEVAILERYMGNKKANGVKPAQLVRRLDKARELAGKGK